MLIKLGEKDYREHLKEQIYFLQSSAKSYDLGNEIEAKRMAVTLRVLLYDTSDSKSSSLLGQMQLKKKMRFVSTAQKYDPKNLLTQQCLLSMTVSQGGIHYNPLFENGNRYLVSCRDWGYEVVLCDIHRKLYDRKDLIQLLANQDGGAHVDSKINGKLSGLKSPDLTGWQAQTSSGEIIAAVNDPVYASMRQMTFEVLQSLYIVKSTLFTEQYF